MKKIINKLHTRVNKMTSSTYFGEPKENGTKRLIYSGEFMNIYELEPEFFNKYNWYRMVNNYNSTFFYINGKVDVKINTPSPGFRPFKGNEIIGPYFSHKFENYVYSITDVDFTIQGTIDKSRMNNITRKSMNVSKLNREHNYYQFEFKNGRKNIFQKDCVNEITQENIYIGNQNYHYFVEKANEEFTWEEPKPPAKSSSLSPSVNSTNSSEWEEIKED